MVVLYVAVLPCDDHQLGWWEQMGEVLVVNKGTAIPLPSHLGCTLYFFLSCFFRAMAPVLVVIRL